MIKADAGRGLTDTEWACRVARGAGDEFYGVITTGIVCRMGCPARLPLRRNVRLFGSIDTANEAGFRACKRCRPQTQSENCEAVFG